MRETLMITGGHGLLGSWLAPRLKAQADLQVVVHGQTRGDSVGDLTDPSVASRVLNTVQPKVILNLAALTNVDECEDKPHLAAKVNSLLPQNLAAYLSTHSDCYLIHISTDHLYDHPGHNLESQLMIRNIYALSKLAGELALGDHQACVLRTNFFGRSQTQKPSFSDWVVRSFSEGKPFLLFHDIFFSPVHWETIHTAILRILAVRPTGVFNLGSSDGASKADFALRVARALSLKSEKYQRASGVAVAGRAKRPKEMLMDSSRLSREINMEIPSLEEEIAKLRREYQ